MGTGHIGLLPPARGPGHSPVAHRQMAPWICRTGSLSWLSSMAELLTAPSPLAPQGIICHVCADTSRTPIAPEIQAHVFSL